MTKEREYKPRFYRDSMGNERWKSFRIGWLETDLWIAVSADRYSDPVEKYSLERIFFYRDILDNHIKQFPEFLTSLEPLPAIAETHPILNEMYESSRLSGTGPMSAVAGAIAEYVCNDLLKEFGFDEAVVENGGDIFMKLSHAATISIYAGESILSNKTGLLVKPEETPVSVCCSSATVGHSLSFGTADAAVIACRSGALADSYATACCNAVKSIDDVQTVTEMMLQKPGVMSVVIIKDDKVAAGGQIEITVLRPKED